MSNKAKRAKIEAEARKVEEAQQAYVACTLAWQWPGNSRTVKGDLHDAVADSLEADGGAVTASTRMYDWRASSLSHIKAIKAEVKAYWHATSVAWPEQEGTRILPKDKVEEFETRMGEFRTRLAKAAGEVQANREAIVGAARARRGKAFREEDYPKDLAGLFSLSWGYSPLQVSEELKAISATAYAAEKTRQTARVLGAIRLAEESAVKEVHQMAGQLAARLAAADTELKQGESRLPITSNMVEALQGFCERFASVVQWGTDDLAEIVAEAGGAVEGIDAQDLKADADLRRDVAERLSSVARTLARIAPELDVGQFPTTTTAGDRSAAARKAHQTRRIKAQAVAG